jgi:DNA-binding response OmpR family regulator
MTHTPKPLILIVEDNDELANLIAAHLENSRMDTQISNTASRAENFLKLNFANLILLDLNLPDAKEFELMERLHKKSINSPIIFVTGENSESKKVKGLEMGGEDYITKPFSFPELVARVNAVLRRAQTTNDEALTKNTKTSDEPFEFCGAKINPKRLEIVFPEGKKENIGRKELGIYSILVQNPNIVLTRKHVIHSIWGVHANIRSRSIDQYLIKIKNCYKRHNQTLQNFKTIHGVGYIYNNKD